MLPVITACCPAPSNVSVIPSSKVCAALKTTVPAPLTDPAPLLTVGFGKAGFIPIPLTVLTESSIPFLDATGTLVLLLTAEVVVVVIAVKAIFKLVNLTLYPDILKIP